MRSTVAMLVLSVLLLGNGVTRLRAEEPPAGSAEGTAAERDRPVVFTNDIMPILSRMGCNASSCHGAAAGQGGLTLSMFGADPQADYVAILKADEGRRVDPVQPAESLLLLKPTASIEHGGGERFAPDSAERQILLDWLAGGALYEDPAGRVLQAIEVTPGQRQLAKNEQAALNVEAVFSGDTSRNVTAEAVFSSLDESVATVDASGNVKAVGFGQTHIHVGYNRQFALAEITVPQPLEGEFPQAEPFNRVDELVLAKLRELGVPPSGSCSDEEFIRRVYIDVTGKLPPPEEVRKFLADDSPDKRARLIDRLLDSPGYADYWALKWGDLLKIKSEYPSNLWPNAVQAYHQWIRRSIATNKPYDQFVRELLVSAGSNFRDPPANYYRASEKRDAVGFAESTALVFMGVRMECARCHGHPSEPWTMDDNLGMGAFFAQIAFKDTREWKEEIVYLDADAVLHHPRTRQVVEPRLLDGTTVELPAGKDPRAVFSDWLLDPDNPYFARNIVNRVWFWLLGRGIVHEPDDMRPSNPPSNPELLDYLAEELVKHQYDLKSIYRLILNSATYQRSAKTVPGNAWDDRYFSHYRVRRLPAEVLSDALGTVTQRWDRFSSQIPEPYSNWPEGYRAVEMPDGSVSTPFLELFGRPPRDTSYECDRDNSPSMRQALYLVSSSTLESKITGSPRIRAWVQDKTPDEKVVEELFLLTVARFPKPEEKQTALQHLEENSADDGARTRAIQDLMWAALNTKEFLFNH